MAVKLNRRAFHHAKALIADHEIVLDERDDCSEHRPSAGEENRIIEQRGFGEYGRWYLGIDDEEPANSKRRYKFPYGDFSRVHRCGVLASESRAGQYQYPEIEQAAAELHGMLDAQPQHRARAEARPAVRHR